MSRPSLEELLSKVENRYELVVLASMRVRELNEGAKPLVETDSKNLFDVALAEIAAGKINALSLKGKTKGK